MATSYWPWGAAGEAVVTTAGTAVRLSAVQLVASSVTIKAKEGNTGNIFVGGADVDSQVNGGLPPGSTLFFEDRRGKGGPWRDLQDMYVDAATNGDGVDWFADM